MQQLPLGVRLRDRAEFASFVASTNVEAVGHLVELADGRLGGAAWLHGPEGTGKTHLLQAVCARAATAARAGYVPLADFQRADPALLEGWRELDCLCLDDVAWIAGRMDWERALFALFRDFDDRCARLVVSASAPPAELPWVLRDIGSRWAASAIFRLRELDEPERLTAVQLRARLRGVDLPDETLRYLQRRFPRDMRTLYHLLDTLDDAALAAQRRITVPFVRQVLGDETLSRDSNAPRKVGHTPAE